jgi:hypothetical protein
MIEHSAYFVRVGEHRFLPQRSCAGAWDPEELHVSPVNGLLLHEMERWLSERRGDGKLVTRAGSVAAGRGRRGVQPLDGVAG